MADFEYFQAKASEQFTFYRIPKLLFTDERFHDLSSEAKILYGILLDRMGMSRQNGWIDEEGKVFIRLSVNQMMQILNWTRYKIYVLLDELDSQKGIGLIERRRVGNNKPNIIYVKDFASGKNRIRGEPDVCNSDDRMFEQSDDRIFDIPTTGCLSDERPDVCQSDTNNTNKNKTHLNNTISYIDSEASRKLGCFRNVILSETELQELKEKYPLDWQERIDRLSKYIASTGKNYKNHFATICLWADREKPKGQARNYHLPRGKGL